MSSPLPNSHAPKPRPANLHVNPARLDLFEKAIIAVLLGALAIRLVPGALANDNYIPIGLVASEALVFAFILFRRPTQSISLDWRDWLFGLAGTTVPLLAAAPEGSGLLPASVCGLIMTAGLCLNLSAKMTLRRSFGVVAANRGVKIGGPYRIIRHPMYAGYLLTQVGFLLSGPTVWNFGIYVLGLSLQVARMNAEETILRGDPAYQSMSERVRFRLLPFVY